MEEPDSLELSVIATLRSDEVISLASDASELGLDAAPADGLLNDIPVVSTSVSLTKAGLTIRVRLFVDKLFKFLRARKDVPPEERQRMVEDLEADPDYGRRVGEHLIEIL